MHDPKHIRIARRVLGLMAEYPFLLESPFANEALDTSEKKADSFLASVANHLANDLLGYLV